MDVNLDGEPFSWEDEPVEGRSPEREAGPDHKSSAIDQKVKRFRQQMFHVFGAGRDETQGHLLTLLVDSFKQYLRARECLSRDGLVVKGRNGEHRRHPAALIERDSRCAMISLLEKLESGRDRSTERRKEADDALEEALN